MLSDDLDAPTRFDRSPQRSKTQSPGRFASRTPDTTTIEQSAQPSYDVAAAFFRFRGRRGGFPGFVPWVFWTTLGGLLFGFAYYHGDTSSALVGAAGLYCVHRALRCDDSRGFKSGSGPAV